MKRLLLVVLAAVALAVAACSTKEKTEAPPRVATTVTVIGAPAVRAEKVIGQLQQAGYQAKLGAVMDTAGSTFIDRAYVATVHNMTWDLYLFRDDTLRDGWLEMDRAFNGVAVVGPGWVLEADSALDHAGKVSVALTVAKALHLGVSS